MPDFKPTHRAQPGGAASIPSHVPVGSIGGAPFKETVAGFRGVPVEVMVGATVAAEWVQSTGRTRFYKCRVQSVDTTVVPPTASLWYEVDGGVDGHVPLSRLVPWCKPGSLVRAKVQRRFRLANFLRVEGAHAIVVFCSDSSQDGGQGGDSESSADDDDEIPVEVRVPEVDLQPYFAPVDTRGDEDEGEGEGSARPERIRGVSSSGRPVSSFVAGGSSGGGSSGGGWAGAGGASGAGSGGGGGGSGAGPSRKRARLGTVKTRSIKASIPVVSPEEGEEFGETLDGGLGAPLAGAGAGASSSGAAVSKDHVAEDVVSQDGVFGDGFTTGREPTSLSQQSTTPFSLAAGEWGHRARFQLVSALLAAFRAYGLDSVTLADGTKSTYCRAALLNPKYPHLIQYAENLRLPVTRIAQVTAFLEVAVREIEGELAELVADPAEVVQPAPGDFILSAVYLLRLLRVSFFWHVAQSHLFP